MVFLQKIYCLFLLFKYGSSYLPTNEYRFKIFMAMKGKVFGLGLVYEGVLIFS